MTAVRDLACPPVVTIVGESLWKLTHLIAEPAERIVVLMPKKLAGCKSR